MEFKENDKVQIIDNNAIFCISQKEFKQLKDSKKILSGFDEIDKLFKDGIESDKILKFFGEYDKNYSKVND